LPGAGLATGPSSQIPEQISATRLDQSEGRGDVLYGIDVRSRDIGAKMIRIAGDERFEFTHRRCRRLNADAFRPATGQAISGRSRPTKLGDRGGCAKAVTGGGAAC
jgi:hypothetical protein